MTISCRLICDLGADVNAFGIEYTGNPLKDAKKVGTSKQLKKRGSNYGQLLRAAANLGGVEQRL